MSRPERETQGKHEGASKGWHDARSGASIFKMFCQPRLGLEAPALAQLAMALASWPMMLALAQDAAHRYYES
ncbi:hypothetical protein AGABI1DRAFT_133817 [Agaricus bisporus var. burnettii JB137-S8]|uniref:Uncharacterized protein n=1 Tax=Agaricus bisporus var. burnettii (strain JB137-S8 / ATCC MYA-4627 / FGSC 10392) TaxID=597362 RepID=K5WFB3_AGABU|nr:uncharacterized protein AGABI1DRAFT_133817 [Agaricus bisporus var. burnettii JB137-S8]EKM73961.1 hypothetical protein AGABI1DRAFT_133817 [Agaricus bisporus var. burnettii JB137-S8]